MSLLPLAVSFLCGLIIPAVTDIVTKSHLADSVKSLIAACLSALAGALTTVIWAPNEAWTAYALAVGTAFVTTMAAHYTGYSNAVQRATARFGIG